MSRLAYSVGAAAALAAPAPCLAQSADAGIPPPAETPANAPNTWFEPSAPSESEPAPAPGDQPPAPTAPSAPPGQCVPVCDGGGVCMNGRCVSACSPPCSEAETCSEGKCVPSAKPGGKPSADTWTLPSRRRATTAYRHDSGIYARFAAGAAYSFGGGNVDAVEGGPDAIDAESFDAETLDFEGFGPSVSGFLGGTLPNGLVVGGALWGAAAVQPTYATENGNRRGGTVLQGVVALFGDWYPSPTDGLHVLAAAGISVALLASDDAIPRRKLEANGLAVLVGGGYDLFVDPDFSLGLLSLVHYQAGLFYDSTGRESQGDFHSASGALLFSMTYH